MVVGFGRASDHVGLSPLLGRSYAHDGDVNIFRSAAYDATKSVVNV
jgi:hypothetical protein